MMKVIFYLCNNHNHLVVRRQANYNNQPSIVIVAHVNNNIRLFLLSIAVSTSVSLINLINSHAIHRMYNPP